MAHVVTQACCADASCVFACPVNAIHPTPDEPDFGLADMLYIDPVSCVDCGACVGACPVGAIVPDTKVPANQLPFVDINALFHAEPRTYPIQAPITPIIRKAPGPLHVAIVGSGPAAMYAADELLKQDDVHVTLLDRLPTPHGLVRSGVAPDHVETKSIDKLFRQIEDQRGFHYLLNVNVGTDISHEDLLEHCHAVIYATGASQDRKLDIPGEDLPGSESATEFVAWYNGHPDHAGRTFDLSGDRAVIIGNGNVALDAARLLSIDPESLAATDISEHALAALRASAVREVVILGRRGIAQAAFTLPELIGLLSHEEIEIVVEGADLDQPIADPMANRKATALREAVARPTAPGSRRIVFRFAESPAELIGDGRVTGLRVAHNDLVELDGHIRAVPTDRRETIDTPLVLRAIGYQGVAVPGVPFDDEARVIPNVEGRVSGTPRAYAVGWIKRGPTGFIGTNKSCSEETIGHVIADFNAGVLVTRGSRESLRAAIDRGGLRAVNLRGWRAIDRAERRAGAGRPRRKITSVDELLEVAQSERGPRRGLSKMVRA
ncbi:ferredoxin--NADP+ reductase [Aeromicrobium panaciterrae]|uniref:ferredoxin--NADP(+) reductase n=1 Tax=Aeromicrobium panaciterrae TaxID=363861 RepID=A0ABU1UNH7_9ACTN|nr:FAD-dependent oxidoreductase [Aeromicrobium panaciterrae]MDR7086713.1 ferredoxin--NADP+ reductase [Aeromicrobium panaciterrae]